jgi:hypothetical protein
MISILVAMRGLVYYYADLAKNMRRKFMIFNPFCFIISCRYFYINYRTQPYESFMFTDDFG